MSSLMTSIKNLVKTHIDRLPVLGKRRYLIKSSVPHDDFMKVTSFLRLCIDSKWKVPLPYLAKRLRISYNTAAKWYELSKQYPYYDPFRTLTNRAMSDRLEQTIMQVIEDEFLNKHYFFNNQILKHLAKHAWNLAGDEDKLKPTFYASDGWCKDFRQRHHYVWRKAHLKRRPTKDEKYQRMVEFFTDKVIQLQKAHEAAGTRFLLVNMDETSWKIAYPGIMTWAQKGAEEVRVNLNYNAKACITAIATITDDPDHPKLPMAIIAKGKTDRCLKQLGVHPDHNYWVLRSVSGWSNTEVMCDYFTKLRAYFDENFKDHSKYKVGITKIDLIWDCFSAHRCAEIRTKAAESNINLHFVPEGATGDFQPLDVRVFGALKAHARQEWFKRYTEARECPQNKESAVEILLQSWTAIKDHVIESSWKIFQTDVEKAEDEASISENEVLPVYQDIVAILSDPSLTSKYHNLKDFMDRTDKGKEEEEDEPEEDEEPPDDEEEEDSSDSSEEDRTDSSDPDLLEKQRQKTLTAKVKAQLQISMSLLQTDVFTTDTPPAAYYLLAEEFDRIQHRLAGLEFHVDDSIPPYPEVVGIYNFRNNCYINAALQVLKAIPNVIQYRADREKAPARMSWDALFIEATRNYNDFLDAMRKVLIEMDETRNYYVPSIFQKFAYFSVPSSCEQILLDFLSDKAGIGIDTFEEKQRIIEVNKEVHFADFIRRFAGKTTSDFLIFRLGRALRNGSLNEAPFLYDFPLSFKHQMGEDLYEIFLLKAVVCHYPNHYTTYVRRSFTDRFLLINDGKVSEAKIDKYYAHIALYLKCPE